jgi:hypothetical protein
VSDGVPLAGAARSISVGTIVSWGIHKKPRAWRVKAKARGVSSDNDYDCLPSDMPIDGIDSDAINRAQ